MAPPEEMTTPQGTPTDSFNSDSGLHARAKKVLPILEAEAERRAPALRPVVNFLTPLLVQLCALLDMIGPYILVFCRMALRWYQNTATELISVLVGLCLCFFGGSFVATIAAVEAFKLYGWDSCYAQLRILWAEYRTVRARARRKAILEQGSSSASGAVPDVDQVFADDLPISERLAHFGSCIQDPAKFSKALSGLYTGLLGVITTLRVQFARTIALGASIAGMIHERIEPYLLPRLQQTLKPEHKQWAPTILLWGCHFVAIALAWQVQMIIAAVQSAMRGGLMTARHSFSFARKRKWRIPESRLWEDVAGYAVAALGLYTQLRMSFRLPFPLNVILMPLSTLEWGLKWLM